MACQDLARQESRKSPHGRARGVSWQAIPPPQRPSTKVNSIRTFNSGINYYLAIQYIGLFFLSGRNMLDLTANTAPKSPEFGSKPARLSCSNPLIPLDFIAFKYYRA